MPKTTLLGEAPGRGFDDQPAFSSKSGRFLSDLIQLDVQETFRCLNLLQRWPGRSSGKGAAFPHREARASAEELCQRLAEEAARTRIILAGMRVAKALGIRRDVIYFRWQPLADVSATLSHPQLWVAVMPHPSGVNRWWNDAENKKLAAEFLLEEARLTGAMPG